MKRNILLIEPAYRNKYPPLGLMKISAYHKMLGDNVTFYKGKSGEFKKVKWDRIYVTTLFSFYWKTTIDTINFYKRSVYKTKDFYVGGIMASLIPDEIYKETGIKPFVGLLNRPQCLDKDNNIIIDLITPDYDILDEIDYKYPSNSSYLAYMTRGCVNRCPFCAVPRLEPKFNSYISIKRQIEEVDNKYGTRKNLLLLDNNVLASKYFDRIIDEIKEIGFYKGARYQQPVLFNILMKRLRNGENGYKIIEKISHILNYPFDYIKSHSKKEEYHRLLERHGLLDNISRGQLLNAENELTPYIEKYRNKAYGLRFIDFNQGIDPRLLTEDKIKLLSEISINPLRIAFDSLEPQYKNSYENAIKLAAKYGIRNLSNYILYNWNTDTPDDLYNRLKINIELNEKLDVRISSFPMKYLPVTGKNRDHIGRYWNIKYLRAVHKILLVTGGSVMPGRSFFEKAFGKNKKEFHKIMLMPEKYIINRFEHEGNGNTENWWNDLNAIKGEEYERTIEIIKSKKFNDIKQTTSNMKICKIMDHYTNNKWLFEILSG